MLRVHHLLCIPLFAGAGYSGPFCENMGRVKQELHADPAWQLTAVCGPDMICAGCPNLEKEGSCRDGGLRVERKDRLLAKRFGICPGGTYAYGTLLDMAKANLTEAAFAESCQNCRWFAQGLCSYEKWKTALDKMGELC